MEQKRYCECGCGGEVKVWKNNRYSPFLRGHHMRKKGYDPSITEKKYCECGCGTELIRFKNGYIGKYIKGHHLKGTTLSLEYRMERTRNRWGREPILSPYLESTFLSFDKKMKRWLACVKDSSGRSRGVMHAKAVYEHHFGEVPKGYVVHHKNNKHEKIEDDRPDNLMLLPDKWNLRFFPTLANGFGIDEKIITDIYLSIFDEHKNESDLFAELCRKLGELHNELFYNR